MKEENKDLFPVLENIIDTKTKLFPDIKTKHYGDLCCEEVEEIEVRK